MSNFEVTVSGLDEVVSGLQDLAKKYPDRAATCLEKDAKQFRKDVVSKVKSFAKLPEHSGKSLRKISGYYQSPVTGWGSDLHVDIGARVPHFHLVERGHNLVSHSGNTIGTVRGYGFMEEAIEEHNNTFPTVAEKMIDEILKEDNWI